MPRLRRLSGDEVIAILIRFGFRRLPQRGSHVKLRRLSDRGQRQTLMVPRHRRLASGTLRGIYPQALAYIPEAELRQWFYTD